MRGLRHVGCGRGVLCFAVSDPKCSAFPPPCSVFHIHGHVVLLHVRHVVSNGCYVLQYIQILQGGVMS